MRKGFSQRLDWLWDDIVKHSQQGRKIAWTDKQISDRLGISRTYASNLVAELKRQGHIKIERCVDIPPGEHKERPCRYIYPHIPEPWKLTKKLDGLYLALLKVSKQPIRLTNSELQALTGYSPSQVRDGLRRLQSIGAIIIKASGPNRTIIINHLRA